jgi:hypothetical protein
MTILACLVILIAVMNAEHRHLRWIVLAFLVIAGLALIIE